MRREALLGVSLFLCLGEAQVVSAWFPAQSSWKAFLVLKKGRVFVTREGCGHCREAKRVAARLRCRVGSLSKCVPPPKKKYDRNEAE